MEVFIFKTWSPTNPSDKLRHLVGCVPPAKKTLMSANWSFACV